MIDTKTDCGNEAKDLALATLLTVAREANGQLPADLVKNLYELQKRHQFDPDRTGSLQAMQRLLEQHVDSLVDGALR